MFVCRLDIRKVCRWPMNNLKQTLKLKGYFLIILTVLCYLFYFFKLKNKANKQKTLAQFSLISSTNYLWEREDSSLNSHIFVLIMFFTIRTAVAHSSNLIKVTLKVLVIFFREVLLKIELSPETIGNRK